MEGFETEEQQLEAIKKWWGENGTAVIIGAILGIGAVIGYINWNNYKNERREIASQAYQEMVESEKPTETVVIDAEKAKKVISDFDDTVYATMLNFQLAKQAVEENNLADAETYLKEVVAKSSDQGVQHIARIRLGRVLLAANKQSEALTLIENIEQGAFKASYSFLKGSIYLAMGDKERALTAINEARSSATSGMPEHPNLKYILDELNTDMADLVEIDV